MGCNCVGWDRVVHYQVRLTVRVVRKGTLIFVPAEHSRAMRKPSRKRNKPFVYSARWSLCRPHLQIMVVADLDVVQLIPDLPARSTPLPQAAIPADILDKHLQTWMVTL